MAFIENGILETLKSIDRTLKRIAQAMEDRSERLDIRYLGTDGSDGESND